MMAEAVHYLYSDVIKKSWPTAPIFAPNCLDAIVQR